MTHTHTHARAVRLLWTRDRPIAETTTQNTQHSLKTDNHAAGGIRTYNPPASERPQNHALESAATVTSSIKFNKTKSCTDLTFFPPLSPCERHHIFKRTCYIGSTSSGILNFGTRCRQMVRIASHPPYRGEGLKRLRCA